MEFLQHLLALDPVAWGVLASLVTVFTAAILVVRRLIGRGRESTAGSTASQQSQSSQSQMNQQQVTVHVAPTITFPNQSIANGKGTRRANTSHMDPGVRTSADPSTESIPVSESHRSVAATQTAHVAESAAVEAHMVQRSQPVTASERPHLGPNAPSEVDGGEPERGVEAASPSVNPAPQFVRQRKNLRQVLWCASCIAQEIRTYASSSKRTSQSEQPYKNYVRLHGALKDYLENTARAVADLNSALNKLTDVSWPSGDPRQVFFVRLDPLGGADSPDTVRVAFEDMLDSMLSKVRGMGYEVVQREAPKDKPYLRDRRVWHLTKARNLQLEAFDVADDELGDEDADPEVG